MNKNHLAYHLKGISTLGQEAEMNEGNAFQQTNNFLVKGAIELANVYLDLQSKKVHRPTTIIYWRFINEIMFDLDQRRYSNIVTTQP